MRALAPGWTQRPRSSDAQWAERRLRPWVKFDGKIGARRYQWSNPLQALTHCSAYLAVVQRTLRSRMPHRWTSALSAMRPPLPPRRDAFHRRMRPTCPVARMHLSAKRPGSPVPGRFPFCVQHDGPRCVPTLGRAHATPPAAHPSQSTSKPRTRYEPIPWHM